MTPEPTLTEDDIRIDKSECVDSHPCEMMRKDYRGKNKHTPIGIRGLITSIEAESLKQQIFQALQENPKLQNEIEFLKLRNKAFIFDLSYYKKKHEQLEKAVRKLSLELLEETGFTSTSRKDLGELLQNLLDSTTKQEVKI
jgi:hypothetical protein